MSFLLFALLLTVPWASALWTCSVDQDCGSLMGSVCNSGVCACGPGQQAVLGGSVCVDISPYLESPCVEDHQCAKLFTGYHCRQSENNSSICFCQEGHHYFHGRCWRSIDFGESCTRSEECMSIIRDPFSMICNTTCQCADGYYERQRGECRRFSSVPGGGCVLDLDCQFPSGACDQRTFTCFSNSTDSELIQSNYEASKVKMASSNKMASQRAVCSPTVPCSSPFVCSSTGVCICPSGYYENDNGQMCYADLGSPSTPEQCVGLLAEVINGICSCRPNFFYDENMKDCVRVTRRLTESCVSDLNCYTFGLSARCGAPQAPWGFRSCECDTEVTVWDENLQLCRYFAGIGESCQIDSDCLAGELEIRCVITDDGAGVCACPDNFTEYEGLCLTSGLELGDTCQHILECTGTNNTVCDGVCSCAEGYQEAIGNICVPIIGGTCAVDSDCVIEHTGCLNSTSGFTCQCRDGFIEYSDLCWPVVLGFNTTCSVTAQCVDALGEFGACVDGLCACADNYHYRDDGCWPTTGLFETCQRSSQCYLQDSSHMVVCRNSLCQCDFEYPFSEELGICLSSNASVISVSLVLFFTLLTLLIR